MNRHIPFSISFQNAMTDEQRQFLRQKHAFKFFDARAKEFILRKGSIKIGTLVGYRNLEHAAFADSHEGWRLTVAREAVRRYDVHPTSAAYNFVSQFSHPDVVIENLEFAEDFDFYCYCFSYDCSFAVLRSFDGTPKIDNVALIGDMRALADTIVHIHPVLRGYDYMIGPVLYTKHPRSATEFHPHPAFEKSPEFLANKEGRIIFCRPDGMNDRLLQPIKPFKSIMIEQYFSECKLPVG